jgi:folate-binding protein YgfZ
MNPTDSAYLALDTTATFFDRSTRGRLEVTGPDRAKFLHNLTTNDVKRLAVNHGLESFVTNLQGKTLGHVTVLAGEDLILLRTDAGALAGLLPHLEKYGLFDDVTLEDASARTFEFHLAGPNAEELLRRLGGQLPGPTDLAHGPALFGAVPVRVVREAPTGRPGLTLIGAAGSRAVIADRLRAEATATSLGLAEGDAATFEIARIEAGTPCFGQDITVDNLPQELGRDARAISFVKGCYLGQETVARIDALGHVNKHLKGLLFPPGPVPVPGTAIEAEGKNAGTITSAARSPGWSRPVALAFLRTAFATAGTEVHVPLGAETVTARVADLPLLPPSDRLPS